MIITDNPYSELYLNISNAALLDILSRESDYQPLAVIAAKNELASRKLSTEQLADANEVFVKKEAGRLQREKKVRSTIKLLKPFHNFIIAVVLFLLVAQLFKPINDGSAVVKLTMEGSVFIIVVIIKFLQKD